MDNLSRFVGDATSYLTKTVQDVHIGDEASTIYNRAKQFTDEKMGRSERTENDAHFEMLAIKADQTKNYTEKIVKDSQAVLVPNPAARLETFMFDTIPVDKLGVKNTRLTNLEYLGGDMIEAGNEFGPGTPYGAALIRVGQTEQQLGESERNYIRGGHDAIIGPLQRFLDSEMRNIMRERKILENKRLDLDACKSRVRKARAMQMQPQKEGIDPRAVLDQAESELRIAQADYDKQVEVTRLLMEGLAATQTNHLRHLKDFVDAQVRFYAESHRIMQELHREIESVTPMAPGMSTTPILKTSTNQTNGNAVSPPLISQAAQATAAAATAASSSVGLPNAAAAVRGGGSMEGHEEISLSSPPPQFNSAAMKNAEFY